MTTTIREAVGVFVDTQQLDAATRELTSLGVNEEQFGILAGERTVEKLLSKTYTRANVYESSAQGPVTAFVNDNSGGTSFRSISGGLVFTGATSTMGIVVASTGIFGGALLAAVSGGLAVVTIGALVGAAIHQSEADFLEEQVSEGHLLLFVRIDDLAFEKVIKGVLINYSCTEVKTYDVTLDDQSETTDVKQVVEKEASTYAGSTG